MSQVMSQMGLINIDFEFVSSAEGCMTIPAVCVVLDGGPGTLHVSSQFSAPRCLRLCLTVLCVSSSQTIYNAMLNGTPCVVLEGSGRIADVISQVAGLPLTRVTIALIHQLMKKFFGKEYDNFPHVKIIEWTKKVCEHTDDISNYRAFSKRLFLSYSNYHRAQF